MLLKPSVNFRFEEFVISDSYPELAKGIELTETDRLKIFLLCKMYLQPVRDSVGMPIRILSGKRSEELNRAVGGAPNSDHLYKDESAAVDFTVLGVDLKSIYHGIILSPRSFGQCLWYRKQNFIHLSLPTQKHQGEYWEK